MNGKQAKRLRSTAEMMTTGLPQTKYKIEPRGAHRYQLLLVKDCTRRQYLDLKRQFLRVPRPFRPHLLRLPKRLPVASSAVS
jgi:hypothetical protein